MAKQLSQDAVWLITGCSSGLGKSLCQIISQTSHYRLVATARQLSSLTYLPDSPRILKLSLDVTSPVSISNTLSKTVEQFKRIDVLINNAGYGLLGDAEAITDTDARAQFETNFWGPVNLTKSILPIFREVNPVGEGGTVVQITSMGGYFGFPGNAFYHASKFALEGYTEAVAKEMFPEWGIKFLIAEPGGMKTDYAGRSMKVLEPHPAYLDPKAPTNLLRAYLATEGVDQTWAEPAAVAKLLVDVVTEGKCPLRLPVGSTSWAMIKADVEATKKELDEWRTVSESCSGPHGLSSIDLGRK